jgi:hypothetical protein
MKNEEGWTHEGSMLYNCLKDTFDREYKATETLGSNMIRILEV